MKKDCLSLEFREQNTHGILFNILNQERTCHTAHWSYLGIHSCQRERLACLRNPETTCTTALGVLVRTIHFMKSVPSFQLLPLNDRLILLQNCWVPLFMLGLAQERFSFEVRDIPAASILRNILLNSQEEKDHSPPTLAEVHKLKSFLNKVWSLDLSLTEYAYVKGAILFNPDLPGLRSSAVIAELQDEVQRVLLKVIVTHHSRHLHRFTDMLFTASSLQMEAQSLVTELFIRPIIGQTDLQELFNEIVVRQ